MCNPFFSVVTVARNVEQGLRATAAALKIQTFRDFEWIIIDGASTDGTEVFAMAQFASGKAVGVSEPDESLYDAMNKGLTYAKGEYLVFLNAGDIFIDENSLSVASQELISNDFPDVGFFGSLMDFGSYKLVRKAKKPSYIWHGQPGLHQATFFRSELHKRFSYNTSYRIVGDYDALARMWRSGAEMKSFKQIVGINEFDANATSGRNKLLLLREAIAVQRNILGLKPWTIAFSIAWRSVMSFAAKIITLTNRRGFS